MNVPAGVGTRYEPATPRAMNNRLLAADRPGAHIWVMVAAWLMADPASARDPDVGKLLERGEPDPVPGAGLASSVKRPYTPKLAARKCGGRI